MNYDVDVAVIGAGSAGLSALRQVKKTTSNYLLIDPGPLGTTCARVGCMPSKALISIANGFHKAGELEDVADGSGSRPYIPRVMERVRNLRDHFAQGMVEATEKLAGDRLLSGRAFLEGPTRIRVNGNVITAGRIILAVGASPVVPDKWQKFGDRILTTDTLFEQKSLPHRIGVIGLGAVGLELGQALSRLGLEVHGFNDEKFIGGLSDPEVNRAAVAAIGSEWPLHLGDEVDVHSSGDVLEVAAGTETVKFDSIIAAVGVKPNLHELGISNLGAELNDRGVPAVNPRTGRIGDLPVFIAGDANGYRPVLHEALDEGFIAGMAATGSGELDCRCRRTPLRIVFSSPQCAVVGSAFSSIDKDETVIGKVDFSDQSRAVLEGSAAGVLRVYAESDTGRLEGAEMAVPGAEHLGHLLALAVQNGMRVNDLLQMPFYHPVIEEGLRTALRDAAGSLPAESREPEMPLCESAPEDPLC